MLAAWPVDQVAGNWQRQPLLQGRLRLCTRSLFFEPDDVRVPIARCVRACVCDSCVRASSAQCRKEVRRTMYVMRCDARGACVKE